MNEKLMPWSSESTTLIDVLEEENSPLVLSKDLSLRRDSPRSGDRLATGTCCKVYVHLYVVSAKLIETRDTELTTFGCSLERMS